jgi:hypothetical protein
MSLSLASIRTWHEYFPSAVIAGVDILEPPPACSTSHRG